MRFYDFLVSIGSNGQILAGIGAVLDEEYTKKAYIKLFEMNLESSIDWEYVESKLQPWIKESRNFLELALCNQYGQSDS